MKSFYLFFTLLLLIINVQLYSQMKDTISGNYTDLVIDKGSHMIISSVNVSGKLEIMPGAVIEISDPGVLVCYGDININGDKQNKINILGYSKQPGIGIVVKSENTNNNMNTIDITNTIFSNLQLPLYFDFGWKRKYVNLSNNIFINNIGYTSTIQVLNPPFNMFKDSLFTDFKIFNNLFTENNGAIYFEDLSSDFVKIDISNNTFYDNHIYGINNYNITSNFLNGRMDQNDVRFYPSITKNNFLFNYLFDINTETLVHSANFGIYGTNKSIILNHNYWGTTDIKQIYRSIYDQKLNYNTPEVIIDSFLNEPDSLSPAHIFSIKNLEYVNIDDTIKIDKPFNGFIFNANKKIDLSNSILKYTFFLNDSSIDKKDTIIKFDVESNNLEYKINIKTILQKNNVGFYILSNIKNLEDNPVPNVKIGYINFLNELNKRRLSQDISNTKKSLDSLFLKKPLVDSLKNIFQKIELPTKSRFELGIRTGGSIYLGTISNKRNIFSNDINQLFGLHVIYNLFSNLTLSVNIEKFTLSNSDLQSNNNDQVARGMSFKSSVLSLIPSVNYDFVDNRLYTKARKFRPSIGFGIDFIKFNPTGLYNGTTFNLQELGTGGQFIDNGKKPYSLFTLGYSSNVTIKYQFNRINSFGFSLSYHRSFSNYLDDVGADLYPTIDQINGSNVSNKAAAIYFSNPTSRKVIGQYRNNPDDATDSYLNLNIFYSLKLFNK